ncbi:response regulator transcription factor [Actinomadura sp. HBU206391]|nr:response regulator transcription factor [Actinomadura sp. HBU206391]MBC6458460.1 response regulator transcription factor [Actinomadura sp. HBU206391]
MIRVLIAEELHLMRGGLVALLSAEIDISVVAELDSAEKIIPSALELDPHVAMIDIRLRGGFAAARALHQRLPGCGTMIMAERRRPRDLRRAVKSHILGFVLTDVEPEALADAVRRVARGERVLDSELAFAALDAEQSPLTPRELEVLEAAAEGTPPEEIAAQLYLSVRTVRNHLSRVTSKTGARNRVDAIRIAIEAGWL